MVAENNCVLGNTNQNDIAHLQDSDDKQWRVIDKLRDRPPAWSWLIIVTLSSVVCSLITYNVVK